MSQFLAACSLVPAHVRRLNDKVDFGCRVEPTNWLGCQPYRVEVRMDLSFQLIIKSSND